MNVRYLAGGIAVFVLLLITLLASIFGWGLPAATLATTMVVNPRPEVTTRHIAHFQLWHPSFTIHHHH